MTEASVGFLSPAALCSVLAAVALSAGCTSVSGADAMEEMRSCGGVLFPNTAEAVFSKGDLYFGGDRLIEVVADIPTADVEEFSAQSGFGTFRPGVPSAWKATFWSESGLGEVLQEDSENAHFSESSLTPARWVVLHSPDREHVRVFVRTMC
ncbi:hypothetical protein ACFVVM_24585 [Nocardia sp. NPDC058176]|uniref:hypothetical protein n=1 Tax=Nocardia sp. NPDC058176 TaxID=3346368 RepID=UPI0036DF5E4F